MVEGKLQRLLVIISDVTSMLARERAEREQRELITVFQRVGSDRAACEEFLSEAGGLIEQLMQPASRVVHDRAIHTLKGNAGMFGFESFAELCHTIESELLDTGEASVTDDHRARMAKGWDHVVSTLTSLLGDTNRNVLEVDRGELDAAIDAARAGASGRDLGIKLAQWVDEPVQRRFERFGQQAIGLAKRLGKGDVEIVIEDNGVRLDAQKWAPLWASLVHVVRNAVDHGIVGAEESGNTPRLTFSADRSDRMLTIAITDNGAGVNWDGLRAKAARSGLAHATEADLVEAMFADGMSTRETATDTSGRGVGLSALRSVVQALNGTIAVASKPGEGTRFELRFVPPRYTLSQVSRAS
jgi:chemotaxis protein histidine kinase CheA